MRPGSFTRTVEGSSFGADLARFQKRSGKTLDEVFRGVVIELFTSVIGDTPVDTGRARGNWMLSVDTPINTPVERFDKTGPVGTEAARSTGQAASAVLSTRTKMGDTVWLSNNLPYIQRLEYGWSKQAPAYAMGMVRKNMARIQQILSRQVTKAKTS